MNNFTKNNSGSGKGENSLSLSSMFSAKNGSTEIFLPLAILLVFVFLFVIVLPRFPVFSHVVDVDEGNVSASDVLNIGVGDENAKVTELQKNLFNLKYIAFESITGQFDNATLEALNKALTANGKEAVESCSDETFNFIAGLTTGASTNTGEGAADPALTTTSATTTAAAPVIKQIKVSAASTKLRQHARENSLPLFLLIKGDTYNYIEQATDAGGNIWYKVVYSPECNGWVNAKDAECIYS